MMRAPSHASVPRWSSFASTTLHIRLLLLPLRRLSRLIMRSSRKIPAADAAPNHPSEVGDGKKLATPAVRAIAKEHKIDISTVTGTGVGGRVTKADMLAVIEERQFELLSIDAPLGANSDGHYAPSAPEPPQTRASASLGAAESAQAAAWNEQPLPAGRAAGALPEDRAIPVRGYTRTMIKTMQAQVQVPHFGYSDEYEVCVAL